MEKPPTTVARRMELYSPDSEVEALLLKSILDDAGIDYFVQNDTFGSLTVGPQIALYNRKTFWVHEDQLEEARSLIRDFLHRTERRQPQNYPLGEKIRMIFEVLLFGWFMPGRRRRGPKLELLPDADVAPETRSQTTPARPGRGPQPHRGPPRLRLVHPIRTAPPAPSDPATTSGSPPRKPGR